MKSNGFLTGFIVVATLAVVATLVIICFQIGNVEKRLMSQGNQILGLGESTDRLRAEVLRMRQAVESGAIAAPTGSRPPATASGSDRQWLHPELDNALEPMDFVLTLPEADMDGTLRRWYGPDPKGFNVVTENAADLQEYLVNYVFNGLAIRMPWTDPDRWAGELAERVEILDDHKEFIIYLRPGVKWHRPGGIDLTDDRYAWLRGDQYVTASDVIFSFDIMMNAQVENGFIKGYYEELESWEAIDDHTVRVRWKERQQGNFANTMGVYIIPEFLWAYNESGQRFPDETIGLNFNSHWYGNRGLVGTGPYRMVGYESGVSIRLERNEDYFGELPAIRNIHYDIFTDPDGALLRLKARQHTFARLRPGQYHENIQRWQNVPRDQWPADDPFLNGQIQHDKYLGMVYYFIGWNADKPMFSSKSTRQALTMALNRQGIIENVFYGLGEVATGPFYPLSPYHDPNIAAWPFDLTKARALLEQDGWVDTDGDGLLDKDLNPGDGEEKRTPFEFTLMVYGNAPEYETLANVYREDLLEIGVRLRVEAVDWALMQGRMDDKNFDAYTGGWGLVWNPDPYQIWHSSQADIPKGSNRVGFRNAEADEIIETLRVTFDRDERIALCHRFHEILHEEQPYTFFWVREYVVCWWSELQRMTFARYRPMDNSLPWWIETGGR